MKKSKKFCRRIILLAVVLVCFISLSVAASAEASGTCGDNLTWYFEDSSEYGPALYIEGSGEMEDFSDCGPWAESIGERSWFTLVIGEGVTGIGDRAFYDMKIQYVYFPDSLLRIGDYAFYSTRMEEVVFPENLTTIGEYAFAGCDSLYQVSLPESLWQVGKYAFSGTDLRTANLSRQITVIPEGLFYNCKYMNAPGLTDALMEIGDKAFEGCNLSMLDMPAGVTRIGSRAFADNQRLKNVYFMGDAPGIAADAFTGVSATVHYMADNVTWTADLQQSYGGYLTWQTDGYSGECGYATTWKLEGNTLTVSGNGPMFHASYPAGYVTPWHLYNYRITKAVIEEGVTNVGEYSFDGCVNLKEVELAETVDDIDQNAFRNCIALKSIQFPSALEDIERSAFEGCIGLTRIQLPDSVTRLWYSAFENCTGLTHVDLSNVEKILTGVFRGCINLKSIDLPASLQEIGAEAFADSGLTAVTIPGTLQKPVEGFSKCDKLKTVTIENGITEIGREAFAESTDLTKVNFPASLQTIGYLSFAGCTGLKELNLPYGLQTIGSCAFDRCYGLTQIVLPDTVTTLESACFQRCRNLTDVKLSNSLTVLDGSYFTSCTSLETIRIPASVTSIEGYGFSGCDKLKSIVFEGNAPSWGRLEFNNVLTIYYPEGNSTWDQILEDYGNSVDLEFVSYTQPKAPVSVKISNVASSGKIKLTWGKVNGAVKYEVYRARAINGQYSLMKTTTTNAYTDTTAEAGKVYFYQIKAVTDMGIASEFSSKVSCRCNLPRAEVSVSNVASSGKMMVSWKKIDGAVKYEVYQSDSKNGTFKLVKTTTATSYINTTASVGKTCYYKVKAIHSNSSANAADSAVKSGTCALVQPNVKISNNGTTGKNELTWTKLAGAKEYQIWRSTAKNGTCKLIKTTTSTSYTDSNSTAGKTYYYKVKAVHSVAKASSAFSAIKSGLCDLAQPNVKVTNAAATGKVKLSWTKLAGAKSYKIYRSTSKTGSFTPVKTTTALSYTDPNTTAGKTYYYKVQAIHSNTNANSVLSKVQSGIGDLPQPTVEITNHTSTGKVRLVWTKIAGAKSYQIYRAASRNGAYSLIQTTTANSFIDTDTAAGKAYYYKVMALHKNKDANSTYSTVKTGICDLAQPKISVSLSAGKPKVQWATVAGAKEYQLYQATSKDGDYKLVKTTTSLSYTFAGAKKGTTYYYKVMAVHKLNTANSAFSTVASIRSK